MMIDYDYDDENGEEEVSLGPQQQQQEHSSTAAAAATGARRRTADKDSPKRPLIYHDYEFQHKTHEFQQNVYQETVPLYP